MTIISKRETLDPPLGTCPNCEDDIEWPNPVIIYETSDGWPRMLAECLGCDEVVAPR